MRTSWNFNISSQQARGLGGKNEATHLHCEFGEPLPHRTRFRKSISEYVARVHDEGHVPHGLHLCRLCEFVRKKQHQTEAPTTSRAKALAAPPQAPPPSPRVPNPTPPSSCHSLDVVRPQQKQSHKAKSQKTKSPSSRSAAIVAIWVHADSIRDKREPRAHRTAGEGRERVGEDKSRRVTHSGNETLILVGRAHTKTTTQRQTPQCPTRSLIVILDKLLALATG